MLNIQKLFLWLWGCGGRASSGGLVAVGYCKLLEHLLVIYTCSVFLLYGRFFACPYLHNLWYPNATQWATNIVFLSCFKRVCAQSCMHLIIPSYKQICSCLLLWFALFMLCFLFPLGWFWSTANFYFCKKINSLTYDYFCSCLLLL
jgi:hypothetical protein